MNFKSALSILVLAFVCSGAPVSFPDSQTLSADDPGLAKPVIALPNTTWEVWFNDNMGPVWWWYQPTNDDFDFNDIVVTVSFDAQMNGELNFKSANSANVNRVCFLSTCVDQNDIAPKKIWLGYDQHGNKANLPAGTEVVLRIDPPSSPSFWSGDASRNPDGNAHAWVIQTGAPEVPEPSTLAMLGSAMILAALRKTRR